MQIDLAWATVALLPSAAYSSSGQSARSIVGFAFERQQGVHAIGGERRRDFDAWPGELACAAPGVPIFSESGHGGEYLALHIGGDGAPAPSPSSPRVVLRGDRRAAALAAAMRRALLAPHTDKLLIEQLIVLFAGHAASVVAGPIQAGPDRGERMRHARVLEHIEDALDGVVTLEQLAQLADMPLLRFLRSFTRATGFTPHAYLAERRVQRARKLLADTDLALAEIAAGCGFAQQSHMGAVLKAKIGSTPLQYRLAARALRHRAPAATPDT